MYAKKMIPWLWVRLVLVVAFIIFVAVKHMYLVAGIAALMAVVTLLQLRTAYKQSE